jgi:hypothetical protein
MSVPAEDAGKIEQTPYHGLYTEEKTRRMVPDIVLRSGYAERVRAGLGSQEELEFSL